MRGLRPGTQDLLSLSTGRANPSYADTRSRVRSEHSHSRSRSRSAGGSGERSRSAKWFADGASSSPARYAVRSPSQQPFRRNINPKRALSRHDVLAFM